MINIKAHFDGRVIVPDEPVDFAPGQALIVRVEEALPAAAAGTSERLATGSYRSVAVALCRCDRA